MSKLRSGLKKDSEPRDNNNRKLVKLAKAARDFGVDSLSDRDVESITDITLMMKEVQRNRGVSTLLSTNQILVFVAVEMMDYPSATTISKTIKIGISKAAFNKILHKLKETELIEEKERVHFNNGGRAQTIYRLTEKGKALIGIFEQNDKYFELYRRWVAQSIEKGIHFDLRAFLRHNNLTEDDAIGIIQEHLDNKRVQS